MVISLGTFFPNSSSFLWLAAQFPQICSILSSPEHIRSGGGERLKMKTQEMGENSGEKGDGGDQNKTKTKRIVPSLSFRDLDRVRAARIHGAGAGLAGGDCRLQVPRNAFTLRF